MKISPADKRELRIAFWLWLWVLIGIVLLDVWRGSGVSYWAAGGWTGLVLLYVFVWYLGKLNKLRERKLFW